MMVFCLFTLTSMMFGTKLSTMEKWHPCVNKRTLLIWISGMSVPLTAKKFICTLAKINSIIFKEIQFIHFSPTSEMGQPTTCSLQQVKWVSPPSLPQVNGSTLHSSYKWNGSALHPFHKCNGPTLRYTIQNMLGVHTFTLIIQKLLVMHLSKWIWGGGRLTQEFWWRKGLSVRILALPLTFTVRIPTQKIYVSSICNVRMTLERIAVVRVPCILRQTPVIYLGGGGGRIHFDRCLKCTTTPAPLWQHINVESTQLLILYIYIPVVFWWVWKIITWDILHQTLNNHWENNISLLS